MKEFLFWWEGIWNNSICLCWFLVCISPLCRVYTCWEHTRIISCSLYLNFSFPIETKTTKSSIRLCTNQSTPGLNLFRWDFPDNADDGPEMALPVAAPSTWFTDSVSFDGVSLLRVPPDILTLIYLFIYIFMYVAIELMIGAVLMKWANSWKWVGWGQTSAFMRYWHGPA